MYRLFNVIVFRNDIKQTCIVYFLFENLVWYFFLKGIVQYYCRCCCRCSCRCRCHCSCRCCCRCFCCCWLFVCCCGCCRHLFKSVKPNLSTISCPYSVRRYLSTLIPFTESLILITRHVPQVVCSDMGATAVPFFGVHSVR